MVDNSEEIKVAKLQSVVSQLREAIAEIRSDIKIILDRTTIMAIHSQQISDLKNDVKDIGKRQTELEKWKENLTGRLVVIASLIGALVTFVGQLLLRQFGE